MNMKQGRSWDMAHYPPMPQTLQIVILSSHRSASQSTCLRHDDFLVALQKSKQYRS